MNEWALWKQHSRLVWREAERAWGLPLFVCLFCAGNLIWDLCMLGKSSTTELCPQPIWFMSFKTKFRSASTVTLMYSDTCSGLLLVSLDHNEYLPHFSQCSLLPLPNFYSLLCTGQGRGGMSSQVLVVAVPLSNADVSPQCCPLIQCRRVFPVPLLDLT